MLFAGRDLFPDLFRFLVWAEGPKPVFYQAVWVATQGFYSNYSKAVLNPSKIFIREGQAVLHGVPFMAASRKAERAPFGALQRKCLENCNRNEIRFHPPWCCLLKQCLGSAETDPVRSMGFRRGTFERQIRLFEAYKIYTQEEKTACKTPPIFISRPCLKPRLNWTGSVFPLLNHCMRRVALPGMAWVYGIHTDKNN